MLAGFLEEFPIAKLEIDLVSKWEILENGGFGDSWGVTKSFNTQEISIFLNSDALSSSSIMFISTILAHEMIHAEMYRKVASVPNGPQGADLDTFQYNFPGLYEYYRKYKDWSHEAMARHYRYQIKNFIRAIDIATNGSDANNSIYDDLSWTALDGTSAWKNTLTAEQKSDILNTLTNEEFKGKCN
ncbi:hypothetical protein [Marinoscillum sp.]|uniref:hypothetical protein n=1 Tax=Marinoscillum sp. TaxID=2024838 RepID=UPI003BAB8A5F